MLSKVRKALVATGAAVVAVAAVFGVVIDGDVVAAVAAALAPLLVYLVPNNS